MEEQQQHERAPAEETATEAAFARACRLATRVFRAPIATITFVEGNQEDIKSQIGLTEELGAHRRLPLAYSLSKHVIPIRAALAIDDTRLDPRTCTSPSVTEVGLLSYLGVPLFDGTGNFVGVLSIADRVPRHWNDDDLEALNEVAASVKTELELRAAARAFHERERELHRLFARLAVGVVVLDVDGTILYANDAAGDIAGAPSRHLRGVNINDVGLNGGDESVLAAVVVAGRPVRLDESITRADGKRVSVRIDVSSVPRGDKSPWIVAVIEDVTEQRRLESAVKESEHRYRALIQALPNCAVVFFDRDRRHLIAEGDSLHAVTGYDKEHIVGRTVDEIAKPEERANLVQLYNDALNGCARQFETMRSGRWFAFHSASVFDADGAVLGGLILSYDVTRRVRIEQRLRDRSQSVELLEMIANIANQAVSSTDAMRRCLELVCTHFAKIVGHIYVPIPGGKELHSSGISYGDDDVSVQPFLAFTKAQMSISGRGLAGLAFSRREPQWREDVTQDPLFRRRDLARKCGLKTGAAFPVFIGDEVAAVIELYARESSPPDQKLLDLMTAVGTQLGRVFERERYQGVIRRHAVTDELTGLYNRRGFLELAADRLTSARQRERSLVLFFADVDGLKSINDNLGHAEGDVAIVAAASVLRQSFRGEDIVARLGGDEFVVLAEIDPAMIGGIKARIEQQIVLTNGAGDRRFALAMSVGTTQVDTQAAVGIDEYLRIADAAMYELKRTRKSHKAA